MGATWEICRSAGSNHEEEQARRQRGAFSRATRHEDDELARMLIDWTFVRAGMHVSHTSERWKEEDQRLGVGQGIPQVPDVLLQHRQSTHGRTAGEIQEETVEIAHVQPLPVSTTSFSNQVGCGGPIRSSFGPLASEEVSRFGTSSCLRMDVDVAILVHAPSCAAKISGRAVHVLRLSVRKRSRCLRRTQPTFNVRGTARGACDGLA